ncbi:MAG: hypothetical protein KDA58_10415 [Planctomycetaceae bacterium]|nr:hypothetical protein [Planctomycetaceae bacterium]
MKRDFRIEKIDLDTTGTIHILRSAEGSAESADRTIWGEAACIDLLAHLPFDSPPTGRHVSTSLLETAPVVSVSLRFPNC